MACESPAELRSQGQEEPIQVRVGPRPIDVVAGDVDGDGRLDLATANEGDGTISVRLQGDGGWAPAPGDPVAAGDPPHLLALADFDADGDLDLAATSHDSDRVAVWLGDRTGRFSPAPGSPFRSVGAARPHNHGLAVGDLDGDGDADLIAADQEARAVAVLLADGRGRLARAPGSPEALGGETYPPALGDLDGDDRLDLVAPLVGTGAVAVLIGDGRGGLRPGPGSPHRTSLPRPYAVVLGDLDGDGALDVIAPHDDSTRVTVLLGDGKGGLRDAPGSPVSLGLRVGRGAIADADGDGNGDLIAAGSGALLLVPGDGRGGLRRPRRVGGVSSWVALAADLNGDGGVDLVAPDSESDAIHIYLGRNGSIRRAVRGGSTTQ